MASDGLVRPTWLVRPLSHADLPGINRIDMSFTSLNVYEVRRRETNGALVYSLSLRQLDKPYCCIYTDWDWAEVDGFAERLQAGSVFGAFAAAVNCEQAAAPGAAPNAAAGLSTAATPSATAAPPTTDPVGLIEMEYAPEQNAARLLSLYVHRPCRGSGAGKALLQQGIAWARSQQARAVLLRTQAGNAPAIAFYHAHGFRICGLHDMFYTNDDAAHHETTVFMSLPLE